MIIQSRRIILIGSLFVSCLTLPLLGDIPVEETEDSGQLVNALNTGNYAAALEILHGYGITNSTLEGMATYLGRPVQRVTMQEPFLKGYLFMSELGHGKKVWARALQAGAINYPTPLWVADNLNMRDWALRCDRELMRSPVPPIAVLNLRLPDAQVIRFFRWYDRYAEHLHSVGLNWYHLNNFDAPDHAEAYRVLNALQQLIKARKPDAFVWLMVERAPDNSDLSWLRTMTFGYDGLMVGNLRDFSAHFEETRKRYLPYVREGMPMVLVGFSGYEAPLTRAAALPGNERPGALLGVGKIIGRELKRKERHLQELGYRGLVVDWRVVEAVAAAE